MGVSKLFMSKSDYLRCKSLHSLPKFASKTQRIQVGNGQYISVLFIVPIMMAIPIDIIIPLCGFAIAIVCARLLSGKKQF